VDPNPQSISCPERFSPSFFNISAHHFDSETYMVSILSLKYDLVSGKFQLLGDRN
jgi:hypothetical protein